MEHGPAMNLRKTPGQLASQMERKETLSLEEKYTSPNAQSARKKRKKKRSSGKAGKYGKKADLTQPSVSGYVNKHEKQNDNEQDVNDLKLGPVFCSLPVYQRIKVFEKGYHSEPDIETRKKEVKKRLIKLFEKPASDYASVPRRVKKCSSLGNVAKTGEQCTTENRNNALPVDTRNNFLLYQVPIGNISSVIKACHTPVATLINSLHCGDNCTKEKNASVKDQGYNNREVHEDQTQTAGVTQDCNQLPDQLHHQSQQSTLFSINRRDMQMVTNTTVTTTSVTMATPATTATLTSVFSTSTQLEQQQSLQNVPEFREHRTQTRILSSVADNYHQQSSRC